MRRRSRWAPVAALPAILVTASIATAGGHAGADAERAVSGFAGDLRYEVASTVLGVGSHKGLLELCRPRQPAGGGGLEHGRLRRLVHLRDLPSGSRPPDSGWYVSVENQGSAPIGITLTGICAPATTELDYSLKTVHQGPGTIVSRDVRCAGGKAVIGGGVRTTGDFDEMLISESSPVDGADGDSRPDDGWRATVTNPITAEPKQFRVVAICADPKRARLA